MQSTETLPPFVYAAPPIRPLRVPHMVENDITHIIHWDLLVGKRC